MDDEEFDAMVVLEEEDIHCDARGMDTDDCCYAHDAEEVVAMNIQNTTDGTIRIVVAAVKRVEDGGDSDVTILVVNLIRSSRYRSCCCDDVTH